MSEKGLHPWEQILRRVAGNPDPRVPSVDERRRAFKLVAELVLHYADVPLPDSAHLRRLRGEHDSWRLARAIVLERAERRWGRDALPAFCDDCRHLSRLPWLFDPAGLRNALTEIDKACRRLERAKAKFENRYAAEAIGRALAELEAFRAPMAEHLDEIGFRRATKKWVAYEVAQFAAEVFERWIGGELHARRDPAALGDAAPGPGFPQFVQDLFEELEIDAHWERPVTEAVKRRAP